MVCGNFLPYFLKIVKLWRLSTKFYGVWQLFAPISWRAVGGYTAKPAWMNTRNTPALAQTVGKEDRTFLIPEVVDFKCKVWHTENLLYPSALRFKTTVASGFCAIVAIHVLALITSSELCGLGSMHAHMSCLPHVYPWCHAYGKMYQALPLLSGRESLGTRLTPFLVFSGKIWHSCWLSITSS